jgi:O-antigen ligase
MAFEVVTDHPLAGIGFQQWGAKIGDYYKTVADWRFSDAAFYHAHNTYLHHAAETGIIGLIFFLMFWGYLCFACYKLSSVATRGKLDFAMANGTLYGMANLFIGGIFDMSFDEIPTMFLVSFCLGMLFLIQPGEGHQL